MVLPLGPGKFYGSSLPRPRIYTDIKFSDERVDPPVSVHDSLLLWASEAHWSMGGLNRKRLRLQGKIEGNVQKLRKEQESFLKKHPQISTPDLKIPKSKSKGKSKRIESPLPPPVSRKLKLRSRLIAMAVEGDEDEEEAEAEDEEVVVPVKTKRRRLVRKLGDDFEMVADDDNVKKVVSRTRRTTIA